MSSLPVLLMVDVQRDYLDRPDLVPDAHSFEIQLASLLGTARARGWPVMHSRTLVSADGSDKMPHWQKSGKNRCVIGTAGAEPPSQLRPEPAEYCFRKRYYSAFEDPALLKALRAINSETLVIAGAYTHACINATVLDAYAQGFTVFVPRDGVASYDPVHADVTLGWLHNRAAQCLTFTDILALLDHAAPSVSGKLQTWQHRNPSHWPDVLDTVTLQRAEGVAAAAQRIGTQQEHWQKLTLPERAERLTAWQSILAARREYWVDLLIRDIGKPRTDAMAEIDYGLKLLAQVRENLCDQETIDRTLVRYRPHGLVGIITPWNNPFAIPIGKIAPALGYGNGVLWKPALPASRISLSMHESLVQAGLGDTVGVVTGDALTGRYLAESSLVRAIAFTGSVSAGRQLAAVCGRLAKPLQAELGGNNAAIVMDDINVPQVAQDLAAAMFSFAGQRCTAIRRVIVVHSIFCAFKDAFVAATEALKVGHPGEMATQVGPVISKEKQQSLLNMVRQAAALGGTILTGGQPPSNSPAEGCWVAPTVMTNLPVDSPILNEELFGPVVALIPADSLDDAIALHNSGIHGLFGTLFSNYSKAQTTFLERAEAGILAINQARPAFAASAPFSGWKASGFGLAEHGRWDRDFYTRAQAVYSI